MASTKPSYVTHLSCKCTPFHLQAALFGFSLAYLSCQHHYSRVQELLLSKVRVLEHRHDDATTVDLIYMAASDSSVGGIYRVKMLEKGMSCVLDGMAGDCMPLLSTAHS